MHVECRKKIKFMNLAMMMRCSDSGSDVAVLGVEQLIICYSLASCELQLKVNACYDVVNATGISNVTCVCSKSNDRSIEF